MSEHDYRSDCAYQEYLVADELDGEGHIEKVASEVD
jgi:hypothetical protein